MLDLFYAGIGSRSTPAEILSRMTRCAVRLRERGYTLWSGAATGADTAFATGAGPNRCLFIPWNGFQGLRASIPRAIQLPTDAAFELAEKIHPAWEKCSQAARALHARNMHQVLGPLLDRPAHFVLCWTPDGAESEADCSVRTGGTATAIRLACQNDIPVYNMKHEDALLRLAELLGQERAE